MNPTSDSVPISVLVVNWNGKTELRACLQSLEAQSDQNFSVLVVDNGSTDGSTQLVRQQFPQVQLVATGTNLGFAAGCNRGFQQLRSPWVATLNNDAEAAPDWIAQLRRAADAGDDSLGMIQSRILFQQQPERTNSTGVLVNPDGTFIDRDFDQPANLDRSGEEVFCASAGAALYRRAMLEQTALDTGVFDRSFFMYYEDVDLGWRCRLAGWRAVYLPEATVYHAFQGSSQRRSRHFARLHCNRNRLRVLLKNASWRLFARGVPQTVRDVRWSLKTAGLSDLVGYAAAVRDGLSQRSQVAAMARCSRREVERRWFVDH